VGSKPGSERAVTPHAWVMQARNGGGAAEPGCRVPGVVGPLVRLDLVQEVGVEDGLAERGGRREQVGGPGRVAAGDASCHSRVHSAATADLSGSASRSTNAA